MFKHIQSPTHIPLGSASTLVKFTAMPTNNTARLSIPTSPQQTTLPSHSKPQLSKRTPTLDARTLVRLQTLRTTLKDIKHTLDIRTYFVFQNFYGSYFCSTCSPTNDLLGSCGPTFLLLRPYGKPSTQPWPLTPEWTQRAHLDAQSYKALVEDVTRSGDNFDTETLRQWEGAAKKLRKNGRSSADQYAENGWTRVGKMTAK